MGWLSDLLQGIPLNAVLKERVALAEQKFKELEAEYKRLKEENETLKRQIEQAPVAVAPPKEEYEVMYSCYYFNGDSSKLYCPRCYETQGKKHIMAAVQHVGRKCTVCDNFIPR